MNEELENLYDKLYSEGPTKNPKTFIQLIKNDLTEIDLQDYSSNPKLARVVADYGICLAKEGHYKKAYPFIEKAIQWFETEETNSDLWIKPMYEVLIFNRGFVNYKLNNKIKAKLDFKTLVKRFPNNKLYVNWLKADSVVTYSRVEWFFVGLSIISLTASFILKPEDGFMDKVALYTMVIGILGGIIVSQIRKKKFN
ncbi:hypothetical protein [Ancylomarina longa]|uniref:Tetratricopeptide repeat protein n=1 Tax=Ancylomarina longa TaxID=2487017 RepID=A0A434AGC6_9BACT|nr:hypothetical protein [Ancylomarina longa]RUT73427.1 hypothetical protein DLK05_13170 [Ancylomarina longa]